MIGSGRQTCADSKITGPVTLTDNKGGVELIDNNITGPVTVNASSGPVNEIEMNTITGPLKCSGNHIAPTIASTVATAALGAPASGFAYRLHLFTAYNTNAGPFSLLGATSGTNYGVGYTTGQPTVDLAGQIVTEGLDLFNGTSSNMVMSLTYDIIALPSPS